MRYFLSLDENGRIGCSTTEEKFAFEGMIEFEMPDDFNVADINNYRIVDGKLIYEKEEPRPERKIIDLKQKLFETDYTVIKVYEAKVTGIPLPDEEAERYADVIAQRREWRSEINQLEASLKGSESDNG